MPSDGPTQWTATLREHGRLAIGPERTRLALGLVVAGAILLINGTRTISLLSGDVTWDVISSARAVFAVLAAGALLLILNNLRTRRWTLVVDADGVALGRRRLAWGQIAQVTTAKEQTVVHSVTGTEDLRVTTNTVKDVRVLTQWLTNELNDHR
ncbi:hypothetical protein [Kribbella sp. NPDC051770]|uniref:hypothetical protein n=1 Tax=Kribbella sp. NPDC051770 TaxID=3155413 RepID=UPI003446D2A8